MGYRRTSKPGDVVRMKGGDMAIVTDVDFLCGGNVKELKLYPLVGPIRRFWLFVTEKLRPAEAQIDELIKVGSLPLTSNLY
ncbi:MAG: hypothetical protein Q7S36_01490 [Candidatus Liptonbacteria bacterium]|nr:hypothetical protein [Candidatus Liptonbacteria bacterium]